MPPYRNLLIENQKMIDRLVAFSGLDPGLVQNIIHFSQCLINPRMGQIDLNIWRAVMAKYFSLLYQNHSRKLFERLAKSTDGMSVESFCRALCLFICEDIELKIEAAFSVYDISGSGFLDMTELSMIVLDTSKCAGDQDDMDKEETFKDLTNMASELLGVDEGPINIHQYKEKIEKDSLLLHILGQVLPHSDVTKRFVAMIKGKSRGQIRAEFGNIRYELLNDRDKEDEFKYYPIKLDLP